MQGHAFAQWPNWLVKLTQKGFAFFPLPFPLAQLTVGAMRFRLSVNSDQPRYLPSFDKVSEVLRLLQRDGQNLVAPLFPKNPATIRIRVLQPKIQLGSKNPDCSASSAKLIYLEVLMDSAIVTRDPEIMSGALCFAGTRVPVKNLFDYLEGSSSLEEFLEDFPAVSRERAVALLEAAHKSLAADASAA